MQEEDIILMIGTCLSIFIYERSIINSLPVMTYIEHVRLKCIVITKHGLTI
jgi:hypothetical protein